MTKYGWTLPAIKNRYEFVASCARACIGLAVFKYISGTQDEPIWSQTSWWPQIKTITYNNNGRRHLLMGRCLFRHWYICLWFAKKHWCNAYLTSVCYFIEAEWRIYASLNLLSLGQIRAGHLVGAKPLFEPMLVSVVNLNKLQWNISRFTYIFIQVNVFHNIVAKWRQFCLWLKALNIFSFFGDAAFFRSANISSIFANASHVVNSCIGTTSLILHGKTIIIPLGL